MKVTDYLEKNPDKTFYSFEILPPLKGGNIQSIFDILDPLMEYNPPFIDVTYHREEYIYHRDESGFYQKIAIRKRPGTVGICASIMHRYGVEAIPHLICGGFTKVETENALIDLQFLGIQNVLALRGDSRKFEDKFIPDEGGHSYAIDLVKQINSMNEGLYLDPNVENGSKTDFCIGVAGYPEKHFEAPNLMYDIQKLKDKVDAGASYIVTQMFFDNSKFFNFVKLCRDAGINVPIIPGIKPLTSISQLSSIPRKFYINFPDELIHEIEKNKHRHIREIGIEWCIYQSKELIEAQTPCIHYYTMGDTKTIREVLSNI